MLNPRQGRRGLSKAASPLPVGTRWEHPHQPPRSAVRFGSAGGTHSHSPGRSVTPQGTAEPSDNETLLRQSSRPAPGLRTVDAPTSPYVDLCVNHSPLRPNADARGAADLKSQLRKERLK